VTVPSKAKSVIAEKTAIRLILIPLGIQRRIGRSASLPVLLRYTRSLRGLLIE
jgi:hypothetical protein